VTTNRSGGVDHGMTTRGSKDGLVAAAAPEPRAGDPSITPELVADHGISESEYALILEALGREPTYTELGVFSAVWSEHCR